MTATTTTTTVARRLGALARGRGEQGSVSIQMVILMPTLFAVVFLGLQGAMYYHARSVAIAAAQEGAREAAGELGSTEVGVGVAQAFVKDAGGDDVLLDLTVTATRGTTMAVVRVSGHSMSVIPGWHVTVEQSARAPVERLTQ